MKKAYVLTSPDDETRAAYEAVPGFDFSFVNEKELKKEDIEKAALIIGELSPERITALFGSDGAKDISGREKQGYVAAKILNEPLILASASPRRRELLKKADIPFEVMVADVDERMDIDDPAQAAEEISCLKAEYVASKLTEEGRDFFVILSADTVVSIDGKILGKPQDENDAFNVLKELQGRDHEVFTGVTIAVKHPGHDTHYKQFHEKTRVRIYPVSDEQIRDYISTGEPLDKAGSYAIQGSFAKYIKSIKGDYSNVVGLPVGRVFKELKQFLRK